MIEQVKIEGFRGVTDSFKLAPRVLVTGPNSAGKSSRTDAIQWALLGCTPGHTNSEAAANMSGNEMSVELTLDGKTLRRTLKVTPDGFSEIISINGIEAKGRGKDKAMIQMAFGVEPRIVNMADFWGMAPGEQRAALLKLCGGGADIGALEKAVEDAKLSVSLARQTREGAEKTLSELTSQMATRTRPAGDFATLQAKLTELRSELAVVSERVRSGQSNDEMRAKLQTARAGLPDLLARHKAAGADIAKCQAAVDGLTKKAEAHKLTVPTAPVSTQLVKAGGKVEALLKLVQAFLVKHLAKAKDSDAALLLAKVSGAITPTDTKAVEAYNVALTKHAKDGAAITASIGEADRTARGLNSALAQFQGQIAVMQAIEKDAGEVGGGPNPADVATAAGLTQQITETEGALKPMADANAMERSMDRARMSAQEAAGKEDQAKKSLASAQERIRKVILEAADVFNKRAMEVLPYGTMQIEEGSRQSLEFVWNMGKVALRRRPSMSGSERVIFDAAVGHAFSPTAMVVIEAAELDQKRLPELMKRLADVTFQVALSSWHAPKAAVEGWEIIKVGT